MATEIRNLYELNSIRFFLSEDYILMNDIDMSPTIPGYNPEWDEDKIDYKVGDIVAVYGLFVYYCYQPTNISSHPNPLDDWMENHWIYLWTDTGTGWDPIGTFSASPFTGTFDGNNHKLTNMYLSGYNTQFKGFFGYAIGNASISNLNLEDINFSFTGANSIKIGGLVGLAYPCQINNCVVSGEIINTAGGYVGGIVGQQLGVSTISNCTSYVNITNSTYYAEGCFGGISAQGLSGIGAISGNLGDPERIAIYNCKNYGNINTVSSFVGGICGQNQEAVSNCANFGNISGSDRTGGIFGSSNHNIDNCYNLGNVTYSSGGTGLQFGGFCGRFTAIATTNPTVTIENCYSAGAVTCPVSTKNGPFSGENGNYDSQINQPPVTITSCFYNSDISLVAKNYGLFGDWLDLEIGTNKTTTELKTISTFVNWDFFTLINQDAVWYMPINDYPKLMWQMSETPSFIGLTLSEANAIISENSFVLGTVTYYYHPTIESGKVISYDPIYSTSGSIINLVISKGIDSNRIDDYVSKDNTIVVYIKDNNESKELADYYSIKHNINTDGPVIDGYGRWEIKGQTVGINCSSTEILDSEDIFDDEILIPLQEALNTSFLSSQDIRCIVLGYNVPGGFYSDVSSPIIISSTSRISRGCAKKDNIFHDFSLKIKNKLYNQQVFSRLDDINSEFCIVCSRIDAPSLELAKEFVDNAINTSNQFFINGKIYIDPYYGDTSDEGIIYRDSILSCYNTLIPKIKNESFITNYINPTFNSIIPYLENDSFTWSWSKSFAYHDLFKKSIYPRVFLYNADTNSAETFRDSNINKWGIQSMLAGYCCYAGAMSNPGVTGYLDSLSFFRYLYNGATVGEAFLYSCPFLDWTIGLFGDPLVKISFPLSDPIIEKIDVDYGWEMILKKAERVLAYLIKKQNESFEIRETIINSGIVDLEIDTLIPSNNLCLINNDASIFSTMTKPIRDLFDFILKRNKAYMIGFQPPNINTYLTEQGFKISEPLVNILENTQIDDDNILDEGWWELEFILLDEYFGYENYFFELEIYEDENCTIKATNPDGQEINILKSNESILGWTYEKEEYDFNIIPSTGVPTSFVNRKIRYTSRKDSLSNINEYLNRGQVYYFKIRQFIVVEEVEQYFNWVIIEDIIYS